MTTVTISVKEEAETIQLAERLAQVAAPGDVVGLCGDLGAGKTFFSTSFARAMGVPPQVAVNSPTFTLINEYLGGRLPIYHMDLYRLGSSDELYDLAIWEYYDGNGICLVEWCDKFTDFWPPEAMVISITIGERPEERVFSLSGTGRGGELVAALAP